MKWILYVTENDKSKNILYTLQREHPERIRKNLKGIKILKFGDGPYIQNKKKKIKKIDKILSTLLPLHARQSPMNPPPQPLNYDYGENLYDMIGPENSKMQIHDEVEPERNDKEEMVKRAKDYETRRQGPRPEQVRPETKKERSYSASADNDIMSTLEAEEELEKYFAGAMAGSGN